MSNKWRQQEFMDKRVNPNKHPLIGVSQHHTAGSEEIDITLPSTTNIKYSFYKAQIIYQTCHIYAIQTLSTAETQFATGKLHLCHGKSSPS